MVGTILVTGATGTVGSEVAKQLSLAETKASSGAVQSTTRASSHEKLKGVELVEVNYDKPETLIPAFSGKSHFVQKSKGFFEDIETGKYNGIISTITERVQ